MDKEIKPTLEDLSNPYVIQLIKALAELGDGSCRFNCRTEKEAYIAGFNNNYQSGDTSIEAYRRWKKERDNAD